MKMADIRAMKTNEVHAELEQMRRHLFDLRAQAVTEKLENPRQLKRTQKDVARLMTSLTERGEQNIEELHHHMEAQAKARRTAAAGKGAKAPKAKASKTAKAKKA